MLLTILLIQVIGAMVSVQVSEAASAQKVNYAAQETVSALRYARQLAVTTGNPAGVTFDDVNKTVTVFKRVGTQNVTVTNTALRGGQYVINFKTQPNLAGAGIKTINLSGGGKTVTYGVIGGTSGMPRGLGSTNNNGNITLISGNTTSVIVIPDAGEPTIQ
jgi:Tfp pilus assembly protein FimT